MHMRWQHGSVSKLTTPPVVAFHSNSSLRYLRACKVHAAMPRVNVRGQRTALAPADSPTHQ